MNDALDITFNKHGGNPESTAAHESIVPTKAAQRAVVLSAIRATGLVGLTSDEAEQLLGLRHQACSARFTELKESNFIEPAGKRKTRSGRTAQAWRVA